MVTIIIPLGSPCIVLLYRFLPLCNSYRDKVHLPFFSSPLGKESNQYQWYSLIFTDLLVPMTLAISSSTGILSYTINFKYPVITHPLSPAVKYLRRSIISNYIGNSYEPPTNSAIHKAAGLMVPGHSMILPGTIPETPISCEWSCQQEWVSEVVPTGRTPGRQLCE